MFDRKKASAGQGLSDQLQQLRVALKRDIEGPRAPDPQPASLTINPEAKAWVPPTAAVLAKTKNYWPKKLKVPELNLDEFEA